MARLSNPFAFTRGPVTTITTLIYLALLTTLIVIHTGVPSPPRSPTPIHGINLTEAWQDLQLLTPAYHPYNSRRNDEVHDWLVSRIESIIQDNKASVNAAADVPAVYLFQDNLSNLTFSSAGIPPAPGVSVYFESTNIIVYIPGTEDDQSQWWQDPNAKPTSRKAVLVNAHYDSVSTGYGATDDGVGVICVLQLVKYFTTPDNTPKNGVVLLLNNGEEDFLNGASVFSQHPISKVIGTFLNLEGAGAGGRATLFRSTDEAVTRAYAKSKYPFGSSTSADGFNRGLIRSQTDYVVFNGKLGFRGLDVAFTEPRARYHTDQDDARHTSLSSIWHMLSAAVATTKALTSAGHETNLDPDHTPGHSAVWFDLLGRGFAILRTHSFFSLSVTLLVAGPIFLLITMALLYRADKFYLFSGSRAYHQPNGDDAIHLYGWRGFFRFPVILLVSCAAPVALAYLLFKENQFIAHSSEWAVWSTMISSFIIVAWFFSRTADFTRPSSLVRAYGFSWLWVGWWALLVVSTVFERDFHLVGTYFVLIYAASVWLATWLSYLELFSLPKKSAYCRGKVGEEYFSSSSRSPSQTPRPESSAEQGIEPDGFEEDDDDPTERTSLLKGRGRRTFKGYGRQPTESPAASSKEEKTSSYEEQEWSKSQWTSWWFLQILVLVPINVIIMGQIGLLVTSGLHQTGQDGSSMFLLYLLMAITTICLFSPIVPILHRFTWHVPIFLFLVLIGTLIYNLIAFPFSAENRLKVYFQQQIDLEHGNNSVFLQGVPPFTQAVVKNLPSAAGQDLGCFITGFANNLERCSWTGTPPLVANGPPDTWLTFNTTRVNGSDSDNKARFVISGKNTRACKIVFNSPVKAFNVEGQGPRDKRFQSVPEAGSNEIRLWSRTWKRTWIVDVSWDTPEAETGTMDGKVVCLWSDANQSGVIPAFDEASHFAQDWVAITKFADGLVEGYKLFSV
ncbi:hypothetical protein PV10_08485 [Exophiala mesophila]|uniref:Peptide hydrolase n=1 Tax=Exophiala mesophila TaxID=212818 RepID=A0A0D1Z242_EXOME|nr:uncharacterized protein PV10_08485 [Exophiala mesophila]KIV88847.1 hypothetical protein PV10_08485 [Exophiala mesophila]